MAVAHPWLLERRPTLLPPWLRVISHRNAYVRNGVVGLLIAVGAIRYMIEH